MESQLRNPEFGNNPENFYPQIMSIKCLDCQNDARTVIIMLLNDNFVCITTKTHIDSAHSLVPPHRGDPNVYSRSIILNL